jgi:hypothetical protein
MNMTQPNTPHEQQREVERQVNAMFARSASFHALPTAEQEQIRRNTTSIVETLVQNKLRQAPVAMAEGDPFAAPLENPTLPQPIMPPQMSGRQQGPQFTGGATDPQRGPTFGPKKIGEFGTGIATGVAMAGQLLREINFPAFVAELVQGVFQAVVDASIQQMKAYGELVQSVTMSLNDFRDQNVSANQGRDHLVSRYPTLMQVNIGPEGPRVGPRPGWDEHELPNFAEELGTDEEIGDLDEETIEQHLVPAARNDLAKQRQSLLATMVLMGINRIIVTDGKINAKLKFDFRARDQMTTYAQQWDYQNMGTTTVTQSERETKDDTGEGYQESNSGWWGGGSKSGESSRWSRGVDQITTTPVIYLTGQTDTQTQAELSAEGQLRSDVTLNFKSETFDLNKLASADEIFKLERVRSAGRAVPPMTKEGATGGGTTTSGAATGGGNNTTKSTPATTNPTPPTTG